MIEIDGSMKSGSGTILRLSIALAGILNQPLHIRNIRQKRPQPGLRPQHLEAVLTAAKICEAEMKGAVLGSRELWFTPKCIKGGQIEAEIGTAGSIPMLLLTVLPLCVHAKKPVRLHVRKGGTDTRNAPTINYLKHILFPMLSRMNLSTSLSIEKYGYYPKGMGEIILTVQPSSRMKPVKLTEFGAIKKIHGMSVCTFLADRKVSERQAEAANHALGLHGYRGEIEVVNDLSNPLQKGSSIALWAETDSGALLGADAIGELGKPSEAVGREAAEALIREVESKATVDVHLADMLVPYVAMAEEESAYVSRQVTEHLDTNMWLIQEIAGIGFKATRTDGLFRVETQHKIDS